MSTILEVAEKAGVSHATITRYFRNPGLLAPSTYDKVKKVVEELNYVPNAAARSLFTGRTDIVSLIVPDITTSFYIRMASGAEDVAGEEGYTLTLGRSGKGLERERVYLEALVSHRVDGVILTPTSKSLAHIELLKRHNIPLVLVDRSIDGGDVDIVCGDSFEAGRVITQHLVEQGYTDIALVGGDAHAWSLEQRLAGYQKVMEGAGLQSRSYLGSYDADCGYQQTVELIRENVLPEAIFAAGSRVVLGVFKALNEYNLKVPDDVAVVCVDDIEAASIIDPFLTVVDQPSYEIGKVAMKSLVDRIRGSEAPPVKHFLPVELIVRKSSIRPR